MGDRVEERVNLTLARTSHRLSVARLFVCNGFSARKTLQIGAWATDVSGATSLRVCCSSSRNFTFFRSATRAFRCETSRRSCRVCSSANQTSGRKFTRHGKDLTNIRNSNKTAGDCPNFAQSAEQNGTVPLSWAPGRFCSSYLIVAVKTGRKLTASICTADPKGTERRAGKTPINACGGVKSISTRDHPGPAEKDFCLSPSSTVISAGLADLR